MRRRRIFRAAVRQPAVVQVSGGLACRIPGHRQSWVVVQRLSNRSAFNGYRATPSAYSEVECPLPHGPFQTTQRWRTTASYVADLPDAS